MTTVDFAPLFRTAIGFDRLARLVDTAASGQDAHSYPPVKEQHSGGPGPLWRGSSPSASGNRRGGESGGSRSLACTGPPALSFRRKDEGIYDPEVPGWTAEKSRRRRSRA
jgi:hypothetical protein